MYLHPQFLKARHVAGIRPLGSAENDELRFADAFENAVIAMALLSTTGQVQRANAALCALLGLRGEEIHARTIDEFMHPEDIATELAARKELLSGKSSSYQGERRFRRPDQRVVWTHLACSLTTAEAGAPSGIVVQLLDITERKLRDEAVRESEERFRRLTMLSSDWYWEQDAQFRYLSFVGSAPQAECDAIGKCPWEQEGAFPLQGDWAQHREMLEAHEPFRDFEYVCVTGHSAPSYLSVSGEPMRNEAGEFTGYRGTARNITAGKLAEQSLVDAFTTADRETRTRTQIMQLNAELEDRVRQRTSQLQLANRELEAFSYSIAHDLRAPLSSIDGFSRALEQSAGSSLGVSNQHYLRRIRAGVKQMAELTDGLLALSSLSQADLLSEPVDLAELARAVVGQLREQRSARTVDVRIESPLAVIGDPRLLQQVMANLIGNAWKFTSHTEHARIEVGALWRRGGGAFYVRDNGAGFDLAHASRLFQAFHRMHSASEFEGNGIGLAIVQKVVVRHGGLVWAESAPGKGATFYFTLAPDIPVGP